MATRFAAQSVLLDAARAGKRLVAVGERGVVVLSDDEGVTWRQASVPVSVTLVAVQFPTPKTGWAVGHYGVVLKSEDGGETWSRQLDGNAAARLFSDAASAAAARLPGDDPAAKKLLADAGRMVNDGPDKPFLDLYFEDDRRGMVVGAYNLMLRTEDGGKTWTSLSDKVDNPGAHHIYAVKGAGKHIYLVGEQGLVLRSVDGGASFTRVATPYEGSYFAAAVFPSGTVVAVGLRGNAYRSTDHGATWQRIEGLPPITLNAATVVDHRLLVLANQAGQLYLSPDEGKTVQPLAMTAPLPPVASVVSPGEGTLLAVGVRGVARLPMPAALSAAAAPKR